eukprot:1161590-Pelagomonas_calceolata.AAC.3
MHGVCTGAVPKRNGGPAEQAQGGAGGEGEEGAGHPRSGREAQQRQDRGHAVQVGNKARQVGSQCTVGNKGKTEVALYKWVACCGWRA